MELYQTFNAIFDAYDVVVCPGVIGNVVLKLLESMGDVLVAMGDAVYRERLRWRAGRLLLRDGLARALELEHVTRDDQVERAAAGRDRAVQIERCAGVGGGDGGHAVAEVAMQVADVAAMGVRQQVVVDDHRSGRAERHKDDRRTETRAILAAHAMDQRRPPRRLLHRFEHAPVLGTMMQRVESVVPGDGPLDSGGVDAQFPQLLQHFRHTLRPEAELRDPRDCTGRQPVRVGRALVGDAEVDHAVKVERGNEFQIPAGERCQRVRAEQAAPPRPPPVTHRITAQIAKVHRPLERQPAMPVGALRIQRRNAHFVAHGCVVQCAGHRSRTSSAPCERETQVVRNCVRASAFST